MKQFRVVIKSKWAAIGQIIKEITAPNEDVAKSYALQGYPDHWFIASIKLA